MVMKIDAHRGVKIDTSKAQKKFSQDNQQESDCAICATHVYQVEKVKAERKIFHKQCFRCKECKKQLNMDNYNSHEGQLYCHIHFKQLLRPKPVDNQDDFDSISRRQRSVIIRESVPQELPPDVIRCNSKVDDGLDSIHLDLSDIRQRFENKHSLQASLDKSSSEKSTERASPLHKSDSILARLQKYESVALGMDQDSQKSFDSNDESNEQRRSSVTNGSESPDQPRSFADLNSLKNQWERATPSESSVAENAETREELASLRQRIGVGRSASLRQMYEQGDRPNSSADSLPATSPAPYANGNGNAPASRELAESMRRRFEQGEFESEHDVQYREKLRRETQEELHLVQEADTAAKEAKQIFHRLDKMQSITKPSQTTNGHSNGVDQENGEQADQVDSSSAARPVTRRILSVPNEQPTEVVKSSEPGVKDLPTIDTAQLQERYRFFERQASSSETSSEVKKGSGPPPKPISLPRDTGNMSIVETPAEQIQRDPNVIRSSDVIDDRPKGETTKRMLNVFKRMEQLRDSVDEPSERPKPPPLRCITPPAEYTIDDEESSDLKTVDNGNANTNDDRVKGSYRSEESIPVEPEKTRTLKAKFENWAELENKENRRNLNSNEIGQEVPQLDITKNLRQKFETISEPETPKEAVERTKPKVHRFVSDFANAEKCCICTTKIYPMEKLEFSNMKLHRNCFRCCHCASSLRLENYTLAAGKLYCLVHFRQLFMSKGNYDEGFGREQHKDKWNSNKLSIGSSQSSRNTSPYPDSLNSDENHCAELCMETVN